MTKWAAVWGSLDYLMKGALATVELSFTVVLIGTALGLIGGLLRVMPHPRLRRVVGVVVEGVRSVPLLLQMFFIFFGLPALGIEMPVFLSAVLAMTLWMAVNSTEVFRGAVQSIAPGQSEAAYSTGLGYWETMRFVIVPQAVRRMLPPFVGLCTILIKDSSLAAIIGVFELTRAAQETIERTFASVELYLFAAAVYFVICFPLTSLSRRLEARLSTPGLGAVAAGR
jgi:polar amino acid transport system permease protein